MVKVFPGLRNVTRQPFVQKIHQLPRLVMRKLETSLWHMRWSFRSRGSYPPELKRDQSELAENLDVVVISLVRRKDRRLRFSSSMHSFGLRNYRFLDAIDGLTEFPLIHSNQAGAKACAESHRLGLESHSKSIRNAIMICEDDIEFLLSKNEIQSIITDFLTDARLDVLCLSARVRGSKKQISEQLAIATRIVTGACYVVKPHMIPILIQSFKESSQRISEGKRKAAIDQHWHRLQTGRYFFAVPLKKAVKIVAGYSDIQGKELPDVF